MGTMKTDETNYNNTLRLGSKEGKLVSWRPEEKKYIWEYQLTHVSEAKEWKSLSTWNMPNEKRRQRTREQQTPPDREQTGRTDKWDKMTQGPGGDLALHKTEWKPLKKKGMVMNSKCHGKDTKSKAWANPLDMALQEQSQESLVGALPVSGEAWAWLWRKHHVNHQSTRVTEPSQWILKQIWFLKSCAW